MHSVNYKNASAWKGKRGIVIGTANTAHDIAEDMLEAGLRSVTMIQRSPTCKVNPSIIFALLKYTNTTADVIPAEYPGDVISLSYNEHIPTAVADQLSWSMPAPILALMYNGMARHRASMEPQRYDALEEAGFKLKRNGSLAEHIWERFGGHYVDVGASQKIASGKIQVKSDSLPVRYVEDGLEFEDDERLQADVVVFATGFDVNVKKQVASLFSPEIAEKMGDWWGIDSEGEIRGTCRPCGRKLAPYPLIWSSIC